MQDIRCVNNFCYLQGPVATADESAGGGGSGSGSQQVYTGASPPAAPDDPTLPAVFYPSGGGTLSQWTGAAWV